MANTSSRDRMVESIEELTGDKCSDAILAQSRPKWIIFPAIAVGVLLRLLTDYLGLPTVVIALSTGAGVAAVFISQTTYWIVARLPKRRKMIIASSKKTNVKAVEVVEELRLPAGADLESAVFSKRWVHEGRTYYVARQFERRFYDIAK